MAGVEALARLGGGVSRMDSGAPATGGSELSGIELAGLLSGLSDEEMAWAILVYVGEAARYEYVRELVRQHALSLKRRQHWRAASDDQAIVLADVAFEDVVSPGRCPRCHGVCYVGAKVCGKCQGSGQVRRSDRQIAAALDVCLRSFQDSWARRLADVLGYVHGLDGAVRGAVGRNSRRFDENIFIGA